MARRRNLQGVERGCLGTIFLGPGMILQWFMYMFPAKGKARSNTRLARSPLMTWVYSFVFWAGVLGVALGIVVDIIDPGRSTRHMKEEMNTSGSADAGGAIEDSTDSIVEEKDF